MFSINSELLRNFLLDMNGKSYILYLQVNKCSARLKGPAGINHEKEKRILRKYRLYAAGICTVLALGIGGCASNGASAATETRQESQEASKEETTEADTAAESAADNVEDMNGQDALQSLRIYGPVTKQEDGRLSIDNQSDMSISGEIILNVSEEYTYILDAVTGLPLKEEDIKDDKSMMYALCTDLDVSSEIVAIILVNHLFSPDDITDYASAIEVMSRNDKLIAFMKARILNSVFEPAQWAAIIIEAINSIDLSPVFTVLISGKALMVSQTNMRKKVAEQLTLWRQAKSEI